MLIAHSKQQISCLITYYTLHYKSIVFFFFVILLLLYIVRIMYFALLHILCRRFYFAAFCFHFFFRLFSFFSLLLVGAEWGDSFIRGNIERFAIYMGLLETTICGFPQNSNRSMYLTAYISLDMFSASKWTIEWKLCLSRNELAAKKKAIQFIFSPSFKGPIASFRNKNIWLTTFFCQKLWNAISGDMSPFMFRFGTSNLPRSHIEFNRLIHNNWKIKVRGCENWIILPGATLFYCGCCCYYYCYILYCWIPKFSYNNKWRCAT